MPYLADPQSRSDSETRGAKVALPGSERWLLCSGTIPSVELPGEGAAWTAGAACDAARAIDAACSKLGYFFLRNHGIPADTIVSAIEAAREFYARPLPEKASYRSSAKSQFLGYRCLGAERSLSHSGAEACEQYRIGNVFSAGSGLRAVDRDFFHRPFQKSIVFFADMTRVGDRLMAAGAVGLKQEPNFFDRFFDAPMHRLGLNFYETGAGAKIGNTVSYAMSSHLDHAVFTIVVQNEPGLEVLSPDGDWVDVPIIPDA